jgi:hypothetical protein
MDQSISKANYKGSAAILRGHFLLPRHPQAAVKVIHHAAQYLASQHAADYDKL